jgi:hypothetical protein
MKKKFKKSSRSSVPFAKRIQGTLVKREGALDIKGTTPEIKIRTWPEDSRSTTITDPTQVMC